ncbi:lactonase family protein [Breznakia pachnodae]|uniref:6-phosphogluconolactonase (Cycloisomerase 2 family) n=1 Tax=Breznakia pachnodae TaxID=265178 RepID=A0ABU0E3L7_9FIRM|nr:beta-propeller fold lactonase family protein [Breznakia pachnodae]MDQ0361480.1 6-phosphogluconolactonase (cycloisomerase 2 family) [Breznakia pachnodae]
MQKDIFIVTYGKEKDKGNHIVKLIINLDNGSLKNSQTIDLDGKANMVVETEDSLITSVENANGGSLEFYNKKTMKLTKKYQCDYFYSYGQVIGNKLLLASYSKGVDSVFDIKKGIMVKSLTHARDGIQASGRSHYIRKLSDGRVISVDNAFQQLYIYKNDNLDLDKIIDLPMEPLMNIRLMSFTLDEKWAYLNTEKSGEVIVLNTDKFEIVERYTLSSNPEFASGGNVISLDGKYECVSMRGEESIYVYNIRDDGSLNFSSKFGCGETPRDLAVISDYLLVSCTDESLIEVHKFKGESIEKIAELDVYRPITFALGKSK